MSLVTVTSSDGQGDRSNHNMSDAGYVVVAVLLFIVWTMGTVLNVISVCVFAFNKSLRSPTNLFVVSLNVCDLGMCFVGTFMAMTSAWRKKWLYGHFGCVFEGFVVYFLGLTSVFLLSAVSLDRYVLIAQPLHGPRITHKVAALAISACWMGGFLWSAFPLFGWNEYVLEGAGISCSVVWESSNPTYTSYIFTIFVFVFVLPVSVMAFSYCRVFMTIRDLTRNNSWNEQSSVVRNNLRVKTQLARTIAFIIGAFLFCWMPYAAFSFTVVFQGSDAVSRELATYPAVLAKCQGVINPLLYVASNKQFRRAFYDLIPCKILRQALQRRKDQPQHYDVNEVKATSKPSTHGSKSDICNTPALKVRSNRQNYRMIGEEAESSLRTKTERAQSSNYESPTNHNTGTQSINWDTPFERFRPSRHCKQDSKQGRIHYKTDGTLPTNSMIHPDTDTDTKKSVLRISTVSGMLESTERITRERIVKREQPRSVEGERPQMVEL